jgi:hypothetical protein
MKKNQVYKRLNVRKQGTIGSVDGSGVCRDCGDIVCFLRKGKRAAVEQRESWGPNGMHSGE